MKKFLKGVRGKQILVSGLSVLVLVAGYFRWSADQKEKTVAVMNEVLPEIATEEKVEEEQITGTDDEGEENYFARARYERDCARSEATELLRVSAENGDVESDIGIEIAGKLAKYAKDIEDEAAIENMVIAKGFADCVAFVDDSGIKIVVKSENLEKEGVGKIKDIVIRQTGAKPTEIKISGRN